MGLDISSCLYRFLPWVKSRFFHATCGLQRWKSAVKIIFAWLRQRVYGLVLYGSLMPHATLSSRWQLSSVRRSLVFLAELLSPRQSFRGLDWGNGHSRLFKATTSQSLC